MKKVILTLSAIFVLGVININAQEKKVQNVEHKSDKVKTEQKKNEKVKKVSEVTLSVAMHCGGCEEKVRKQLSFEKGVKEVITNLEKQTVVVKYDNTVTDSDKLISSLSKINYKATVATKSSEVAKPAGCNKPCNTPCGVKKEAETKEVQPAQKIQKSDK